MSSPRWLIYPAVAVPPLILAAVGVSHPMDLTAQSAEYWRNLHIGILPIFPLLGFAPWLVVRGRDATLSWVVGVLGFLYAAFYTGLDVLAGIGAGGLKLDDMGQATGTVFGLGRVLGQVGSYTFIAAVVLAAGAGIVLGRLAALPGAVLVILGSVLFWDDHIYFPVGVVGQLCLGVGWVVLIVAIRGRAAELERNRSAVTA